MRFTAFYRYSLYFFFVLFIAACNTDRVLDEYTAIPNRKWDVKFQPSFTFEVVDTNQIYNVYLNLRNEGTFEYSNLWLNLTMESPKHKKASDKLNISLADPTGKWIGKGLGDLYDCRIPIYDHIKFSDLGKYTFTLEQYMRINPLPGISDVGISIEKTSKTNQ